MARVLTSSTSAQFGEHPGSLTADEVEIVRRAITVLDALDPRIRKAVLDEESE